MTLLVGTNVLDKVVPFDSNEQFATHEDKYGQGGLHTDVLDITERNSIPTERRKEGMLVYVKTPTPTMYQLVGGITNSDWEVFNTGGGGGSTEITRQFIYTSTPINSNEYSDFDALLAAAQASGLTGDLILKESLTINSSNQYNFAGFRIVGGAPGLTLTFEDAGSKATFSLTAASATPGDYFEHYVIFVVEAGHQTIYIWFDTTGTDPEPPDITGSQDPKLRIDISAAASVTDVATAIGNAISGDTYFSQYLNLLGQTVGQLDYETVMNESGTAPVSSTANLTVSSFVAGTDSPKIVTGSVTIVNIELRFKDYQSRAWYAENAGVVQGLFIISEATNSTSIVASVNSTNCTVRPILIYQDKGLFVVQSGLLTIFNISNTNMIEITGNGQLSLFPRDSFFGFGPGNNIYGSSGNVTVFFGDTYPYSSTFNFTLSNYTGNLQKNSGKINLSTRDLFDLQNQLSQRDRILTTGNNEEAEFRDFSSYTGLMLPVEAYADSNVNIATIAPGDSIDSVFLSAGLRVYLGGQTLPEENGVYIIGASAGLTYRDTQFLIGSLCYITGGNTYANRWVKNNNTSPFTLNTDPVTQIITSLTGLVTTSIKTANYTAKSNELIPVDSNGGIFDITLPDNPINGDIVEVVDVDGSVNTNNVTILRNGNNINGVASDYIFSTNYGRLKFQFFTGKGWIRN